jgi:hypothetical protein
MGQAQLAVSAAVVSARLAVSARRVVSYGGRAAIPYPAAHFIGEQLAGRVCAD